VCDARLQRVSRMHLHPRTRGNAAGSMGHDCTHDGGVTEPPCRTFGWMPKSRQPGSGVQLKLLWERWGRGSLSPSAQVAWLSVAPTAALTNRPSYTHRLLRRLVAAASRSRSRRASCSDDDFCDLPSFLPVSDAAPVLVAVAATVTVASLGFIWTPVSL
jgi:hypothetical protein